MLQRSGVIRENILAVFSFLQTHFTRFEIIVVTDGSPDQTVTHIENLRIERPDIPLMCIPFPKNQGKGAAVKAGVLASQYDPILFIDADLTIPIEQLDRFLSALESADIAIASRLASGSNFEEPIPRYRVIMARCFHLLQMVLLGNFEFPDTQCGFKLFRRPIARTLFQKLTIKRFAFDAELLFLATRYNMRVVSLPVSIKKDPRNTNVHPLRDPINMLFALIKIRINQFLGYYSENIVVLPERLRRGYWELFLIIAFIFLGAFLRSYHFSDWLHFEIDQSYDIQLVSPAVENGIENLPLLGPTAGGGRSLRLGPGFYYLEYLSAKIFGNTPPGHAAFVLIFSILSLPLFYFFIRHYFSRPISIGLMALFSTSFYLVLYSRFSWSPNILPFLVLLSFFSLLKSVSAEESSTKNKWWFLLAVATITLTTHIHFNAFFIIPVTTIIFLLIKRPHFHWKIWGAALGIITLLYAPVILSDIQTKGQNTTYFIEKLSPKKKLHPDIPQKLLQTLHYNASNFLLITGGFDFINGKKLVGYGFPDTNKPSFIFRITALLLLIIESVLLLANLGREKNPKRKDFLILITIWFVVSLLYFFSLLLDGYNLYPRFFLLQAPLALIITGLLLERLSLGMKPIGQQRLTLLALITTSLIASNLGKIEGYFKQLSQTHSRPIEIATEDVFPNTERITLSQQYAITDYITSKYSENGEPVYIKTIHEYEPVLWYHLKQRGLDYYGPLDTTTLYQEANYFIVYPTYLLTKHQDILLGLGEFFDINDTVDFGSLSVIFLSQKDEAINKIRQYDSEKYILQQEQQLSRVQTWKTLFTRQPSSLPPMNTEHDSDDSYDITPQEDSLDLP